jgi:flagellar assembly factor FliW
MTPPAAARPPAPAPVEPRVLASAKLGPVAYQPEDVIRFPRGLPGFEELREFLLVSRRECAPFVFLAALEDAEVALPLLPLALLAPGAVAAAEQAAGALGDGLDGRRACYAVVSIGPEARTVLANLRAPVVLALDARRGAQVILGDESLPVAHQLGA